eukprot:GILI01006507.1.p1 GENE.GILI01006507.1~~GILI01006507.1.p1  ORF type:complete len:295 (+),score=85.96 GILI01006507.1:71-886(+)
MPAYSYAAYPNAQPPRQPGPGMVYHNPSFNPSASQTSNPPGSFPNPAGPRVPYPNPAPSYPNPAASYPNPASSYPNPPMAMHPAHAQPPAMQPPVQQKSRTAVPAPPSSFPELSNKTASELQALLNDRDGLEAIAEATPQVTQLMEVKGSVLQGNAKMAEENLKKKPEIDALNAELAELSSKLKEAQTDLDTKLQQQRNVMQQYSRPNLVRLLHASAEQADRESRELSRQILQREVPLLSSGAGAADNLKAYIQKRQLYHLRAAKKELFES